MQSPMPCANLDQQVDVSPPSFLAIPFSDHPLLALKIAATFSNNENYFHLILIGNCCEYYRYIRCVRIERLV